VSSLMFHRVRGAFADLVDWSDLQPKAARGTEIFAALISSDGYWSSMKAIGSDPVVSSTHTQVQLGNDGSFRSLPCF